MQQTPCGHHMLPQREVPRRRQLHDAESIQDCALQVLPQPRRCCRLRPGASRVSVWDTGAVPHADPTPPGVRSLSGAVGCPGGRVFLAPAADRSPLFSARCGSAVRCVRRLPAGPDSCSRFMRSGPPATGQFNRDIWQVIHTVRNSIVRPPARSSEAVSVRSSKICRH